VTTALYILAFIALSVLGCIIQAWFHGRRGRR
jgi:hypothetical protein